MTNEYIYVLQHTEYALDQYPIGGNTLAFKSINSAKDYAISLLKDFLKQDDYKIEKGDDIIVYTSYHKSYPDYMKHRIMIQKVTLHQ